MREKMVEEYNIIRVFATLLVAIGYAGYISPMTNFFLGGGISLGDYVTPATQSLIYLLD